MKNNKTVTRTISVGAISGGSNTAPSDSLMDSRRHSSAGMRALLWATSGAKSLGSSLGSELQTSRDNIFPNILTPDSIPQFTIPSLSVQADGSRTPAESTRNRPREEEEGPDVDEGLGVELASSLSVSPSCSALWWATSSSSSSPSDLGVPTFDRRAQRTVSDPLRKASLKRECSYPGPYMEEVHQHCLDPASRAALSLPHLAKVTTPYGFVTLSQSPQMASEEALLCQAGLHRSSAKRDEGTQSRCGGTKTPVTRTQGAGIKGTLRPATCQRPSKDPVDSQTESPVTTPASSHKQPSNKKPKRRLYEVIRKHIMPLH